MVRTFPCQPLSDPKSFSDEYEPTCCCCTPSGLILIASGSGRINVYPAPGRISCRSVHSFATTGISHKLVYCTFGRYIASLESKSQDLRPGNNAARTTFHYARVYVNWTKLPGNAVYLTHHRVGYTTEASSIGNYAGKFLVIDIPVKYSVTDMDCCNESGNIAISTEAKVYIFLCKEMGTGDDFVIDFDCAFEIESGFQINQVALFKFNIAFASAYEMRAIHVTMDRKESIAQAEDVTEIIDEMHQRESLSPGGTLNCSVCQSTADENFVLWNIEQGCSQGIDSLEHEAVAVCRRKTATSTVCTPTYVVEKSCVKFDSLSQDATFIDLGNTPKEIIGPKDNIKGHPLLVINSFNDNCFTDFNHVTMLYRRFQNEQFDQSSETVCIHSLQWLPLFTDDNTSMRTSSAFPEARAETHGSSTLLSLGLFFSTGRKGFLYDLLNSPKLLTEYDFTESCISACLTRKMLHVITKNGLETYTTRLYSSASQSAKAIFGESSTAWNPNMSRGRTCSSVSFSSGSDIDGKSQFSEQLTDFSEEETLESQDHEIKLKEGYFAKVPPELRGNSTASKSRLSFGRKKKKFVGRDDNRSQSNDDEALKIERLWSFGDLNEKRMPIFYNSCDLMQPCPPTNIEICLIAIYPVKGFWFIGSTEKHVVLLQKTLEYTGKRGSLLKERIMSWNVYVREIAPALVVSREITKLIEGSEFANPNVFYQLLAEAHLFLRADQTSNTAEDKREAVLASIRKSAVNLGDFFSRCNSSFDYFTAKEYYKMAGIKFEQVLLRHAKRDKEENLSERYGLGIIQYLNEKIFHEGDGSAEISEDSNLHILNIFAVAAPQLLSNVILRSKLRDISTENAVLLLESFLKTDVRSSEYRLSNLDLVTIAILRLQLCDLTHAEHILRRLTDEQLIEAVSAYPEILWNGEILSHIGQLLRRHFCRPFADLLVLLYDKGAISFQNALNAYGFDNKVLATSMKQSFRLLDFLETLLNDQKRKDDFPEITKHLLQQYVMLLSSGASAELLKIPHKHIPKGTGHFAARYEWLDQLPPFSGECPVPQDCLRRKQQRTSKSNFTSPESSPSNSSSAPGDSCTIPETPDSSKICSCCCCNNILLKIQSLLCSSYCTPSTYETLVQFVEINDCIGEDSIKLLCFPATGKVKEAVEFVVMRYPSIMLQYARDTFQLKKEQWKVFMFWLLKTLREDLYERWNKDTYFEALKGSLMKLARLCSPSEFITLLPKDGTARFFVPFVLDCYQIRSSISLRTEILEMSGAASITT